jgi:hypothetical protein
MFVIQPAERRREACSLLDSRAQDCFRSAFDREIKEDERRDLTRPCAVARRHRAIQQSSSHEQAVQLRLIHYGYEIVSGGRSRTSAICQRLRTSRSVDSAGDRS